MTITQYITQFDFYVLNSIRKLFGCELLDSTMPFFSFIGEYGTVWLVTAVALLFFKKTRVCGVLMLLSIGVSFLLGEFIMKNLFCRVRPCHVDLSVKMLVERPHSYSFPSGHTSSSFAGATAIFICNKRFGIVAFVFAVLIAFSRLYNYVHYPTDVLGGALLGTLCAVIIYILFKKHNLDGKIENYRIKRTGSKNG